MNIKGMVYISTIAKAGSLSGAARILNVSQPTLSVFLSNLETGLGTDLFLRDKKKLVLTPAGKIYCDMADRIISVKDQTYQAVYRLSHKLTETIVVGATPLRGAVMVAQIFPQFSKRYPDVKLEIKESYMKDLRSHVKDGIVSFALASCYDSEEPAFDHIMISKEELLMGTPAFHPLASQIISPGNSFPTIHAVQLADSPFVLLSEGTTVRAISDYICAKAGFQPTVVFETNNNLVLSNMIRQGAGVGFLPRSAVVRDATDIAYFSLEPKYYLGLGIIVDKNRILTEAERYLAYLVIKKDKDNPMYTPAMNAYARQIFREFEQEDSTL